MRRGLLAKASPPKSQPAANTTTCPLEKQGHPPRVGYVQFRALSTSSSSPNPYSERKPRSHGDSRHQSQAPTLNFPMMVFLFLPIAQMETLKRLERRARWEMRSQSNAGTTMVVSPPKSGDKVAMGGTGSPAWAGTELSALLLPQISTQTNVSLSNKPVEGINELHRKVMLWECLHHGKRIHCSQRLGLYYNVAFKAHCVE